MGFIDECKNLLDEKEKSKHKQSGKLLFEQLEEVKKVATIIRDRIKQMYNNEEYVISSSGKKIVHFYEPFPNWSSSFGRKEVIRNGNHIFHDKNSIKYKHIIEVDDQIVLLADELKNILYKDDIMVNGPYIIHSFHYYTHEVRNDWDEFCGYHPIITRAEKDTKTQSWTKWGNSVRLAGFHDWKYNKCVSFKEQSYEPSVCLIAVEITMAIK